MDSYPSRCRSRHVTAIVVFVAPTNDMTFDTPNVSRGNWYAVRFVITLDHVTPASVLFSTVNVFGSVVILNKCVFAKLLLYVNVSVRVLFVSVIGPALAPVDVIV